MLFLIALCLAALFAFGLRNPLKKHAAVFYWTAAVLALVLGAVEFHGVPRWLSHYGLDLFRRGVLATALWVLVMFAGALPKGDIRKVLMPIRGELSILAAILTLCHNLTFGKLYFKMLFLDPGSLPPVQLAAAIISVIMLVIMIPLTLISFPGIRKKIPGKRWKRIQRLAYGFYGLLYLHIMLVMFPGARMNLGTYRLDVLIYSLVFLGYGICRVNKAILKNHPGLAKTLNLLGVVVLAALVAAVWLLMLPAVKNPEPVETLPTEVTEPATQPSASEATVPGTTQETGATDPSPAETNAPAETDPTDATAPAATEATMPETTESAAPETTVPGVPETTAPPETTVPETTVPETTVPETTVPETTVPETTVPETTVPETTVPETTAPASKYIDGTYHASAKGFDGYVSVSVTIENDRITDIQASTSESVPGFFEKAKGPIISAILSSQSTSGIDAVSGATYSSDALIEAVRSALNQAKR